MVADFRSNECLRDGLPYELFWICLSLKFPFWGFWVILKKLTDFRKTMETGVDPPLLLLFVCSQTIVDDTWRKAIPTNKEV